MTDYRTYPGDRNTRTTPARRVATVTRARTQVEAARDALRELCRDFEANGYRLTHAEVEEWREAAALCDALTRGLRGECA